MESPAKRTKRHHVGSDHEATDTTPPRNSFRNLTCQLHLKIFSYVPQQFYRHVACVCKAWEKLMRHPAIPKHVTLLGYRNGIELTPEEMGAIVQSLKPQSIFWSDPNLFFNDKNVKLLTHKDVTKLAVQSFGGSLPLHFLHPLTQLTSFNIQMSSGVTDNDIHSLHVMTRLTELVLCQCEQLREPALLGLHVLSGLRKLTFNHLYMTLRNRFAEAEFPHAVTDAAIQSFGPLTHLTDLDFGGCHRLTDGGIHHLQTFSRLKVLDLSTCSGITDAAMLSLHPLTRLTSLCLSYNEQLTDAAIQSLYPLTRLSCLDISSCECLTDVAIQSLHPLTRLSELILSSCEKLTDAALLALQPLVGLTSLDLSDCRFTDISPLTRFTCLSSLILCDCEGITDTALSVIAELPALWDLDMARTSLTREGKALLGIESDSSHSGRGITTTTYQFVDGEMVIDSDSSSESMSDGESESELD